MPAFSVVAGPLAESSRSIAQPDPDGDPGRTAAEGGAGIAPSAQKVLGKSRPAQITARRKMAVKVVIVLIPFHKGILVHPIAVEANRAGHVVQHRVFLVSHGISRMPR